MTTLPENIHDLTTMFRKAIFWIHLISGILSGIVIAIMSVTGIAIAFEEEILHWIDRDHSTIEIPANAQKLTIEELQKKVNTERPDFPANYFVTHKDPKAAHQFFVDRTGPIYVNPYNGELNETKATNAHDFIHTLENWHRFFGITSEENWQIGRYINGISNLAFLLLCITGIIIWFPRALKWRILKKTLFFNKKAKGKARDFNWHNVFGIWSLPVLVILSATAVVISFEWGHKIPFLLAGEDAPKSRNFGMMAVKPAQVSTADENADRLSIEELLKSTQEKYPNWVSIGIREPKPVPAGEEIPAVNLDLYRPDHMPSRGWAPVEVNPYTGQILQITNFQDRSPGLRARVWTRFLHTGAAFGFWGKLIATIATAASLVLVYTGFALSWRRFFR